MRAARRLALATLAVGLLQAIPAQAQTGNNILLVSNALSQPSSEIAEYYAGRRSIPSTQILRVSAPVADEISRRDFERSIEAPIARWLAEHAAHDRILYIVLTKDIPLRIAGTSGATGSMASVDSELTLLYRRLAGIAVPPAGPVPNPYFLGDAASAKAQPFTHRAHDIYLVGRLDGYTTADVKAMIDRGLAPATEGVVVLDGKFELSRSVGNKWLEAAAANLKALPGWGDRVRLDASQTTLTGEANVIGFYSWGSNAVAASRRHFDHAFRPGAIAGEYVSTDARTFQEPPAEWVINDTKAPFGGSHQSLIGDLIRGGITGVAGHVAEPFLNATIRPDILFPAYARGFNLLESYYLAMRSLSWQTVVIGDVLCAPFRTSQQRTTELDPAIDPVTEMPAYFSARRVAALVAGGTNPEAAKLLARAESRRANGDRDGMRKALEDATAIDPRHPAAQLSIASLLESAQEWDAAATRYRKVLELSPNQPVALNNLAFLLAVRKNDAASALPLAKRAYALSVSDPAVGDTLAWIHHLLGDDAAAAPIITASVRRVPTQPDFRLHAAFIFAGTAPKAAIEHLDAAIRADATLAEREDVRELRKRLQGKK